jgi:hypothetical protein
VPKASIVVTNADTNISFRTITSESGEYIAPNLNPGLYIVQAEAPGFRLAKVTDARLLANRTLRVDFRLEEVTVSQTVEVRAAAPVINSESATIGNVMESRTITTLPLNGRTLDRLIRISAGVTSDSASNPRVAGSAYWGGIQFNTDGVVFNDGGNGGGAYSYRNGLSTLPSVDAVSEFKMDSNNQKAEFEGSASVTIVSKSGTNDFHGSVFEFNRNKAFAARNFFATSLPKPPYNRNEYGFTVGGPIVRNKTFFFGNYEGLRERFSRTVTTSVATDAMRNGNFSGLATILDPLSGVTFANNQIPSTRIDPRAAQLIKLVPSANAAGTGAAGTINNYVENVPNISDINRFGVKIDHHFSGSDSIMGSYTRSKGDPYFVALGYPGSYGNFLSAGYNTQQYNGAWNHILSPRLLNEVRFGYFFHQSLRLGQNETFDPRSLFPSVNAVPYGGIPVSQITGHVAIGDYGGTGGSQYTRQFTNNLTWTAGGHAIKTGINIANERISRFATTPGLGSGLAQDAGLGRFTFSGRFTNPNATGTSDPAQAFADFLLGYPAFTYRSSPHPGLLNYGTRYSVFVQDDWQVSPKLTLNLGVRYMYQTIWRERDNLQANFNFQTAGLEIPGGALPAAAQQRLVNAYPITTIAGDVLKPDTNNFAPRIGFAFRPFQDSKTVIRGGAGIYYNVLPLFTGFLQMSFTNPPFLLAETFEAGAGRTPTLTLGQPFPGGGLLSPNPAATAVATQMINSESQQWSLSVERQVMNSLGLRASYVGNKTSHLFWYNKPANLPLVQGPGAIQPRRPYQPWSDINMLDPGADSTLHQLQFEAVQRYASGLNFQLEYSWNRSLDNVPVVGGPEDPYNARRDRGNSDQIRRHIFTAAYGYELPFGPGKPFLNSPGPVKHVIGGWEIAGITYLRTGTPFSVSFSSSTPGWYSGRADIIAGADPSLGRDERGLNRWFDPAAFTVPQPFTFGSSARNSLFGPGDIVFDVSFIKNTRIGERINTQFRAEFFNLPNHTNPGNPGANISVPASVGRITSAGDPRQIQFGLKVLF